MVYVHTNIGLISRFTSSYKEEPYRKWDVDAETLYLEDSVVKLEELRLKEDGLKENNGVTVVTTSKTQISRLVKI